MDIWPNHGRRSLGEEAFDRIRNDIITLKLEPGKMVYESDLGEQLAMSRTPVREAIRRLVDEELIEVLPQRGVQIAYISLEKVEETRFVRESLEVSAFKQIALLWNQGEVKWKRTQYQVEELIDLQRQAAEENDAHAFLEYDEQFHHLLLSQLHNRTLMTVIAHMRGHLNRLRYLSLNIKSDMDELIVEHENMFRAIQANDPQQVTVYVAHHLRRLTQQMTLIQSEFGHYVKEIK